MKIYDKLLELAKKRANYFCLLDPDELQADKAQDFAKMCEENGADGLLVGGSIMVNNKFQSNLKLIKESVNIPVLIFPGIFDFVSPHADALLLLSVVTSRNPQMLIGEQVRAAPLIKHYGLEAIGTAYMIIESGNSTSVQFMSGSHPVELHKLADFVNNELKGKPYSSKRDIDIKYFKKGEKIAKIFKNELWIARFQLISRNWYFDVENSYIDLSLKENETIPNFKIVTDWYKNLRSK